MMTEEKENKDAAVTWIVGGKVWREQLIFARSPLPLKLSPNPTN
jgi:hypothetical protein